MPARQRQTRPHPDQDPAEAGAHLAGLGGLAARGFASTEEATAAALRLVSEQLGTRSSFLARVTGERDRSEVLAAFNAAGGCGVAPGDVLALPHACRIGIAGSTEPAPLVVEDVRTDPTFAAHAAACPNIGSCLGVPILLSDRTRFGTLGGLDPNPNRFTPRQVDFLVVLARLIATQLERDRELAERRRAEASFAVERDLLRTLMDTVPDLIYAKDTSSRFVRLNRATARALGVAAPEDAVGKTDADFFPDALVREYLEDERRVLATGRPLVDKLERQGEDDATARWVLTNKTPLRDLTGEVTGLVGTARDVTERRRMEVALRDSEERFRAFMNHQPALAFTKDEAGRYVYVNEPFERHYGVTLADLRGKTDFDWLPADVARPLRENDQTVLTTGRPTQAIEEVPVPGGASGCWLSTKFLFADAAGRRFVGGVAVDITERLRAERERERHARHVALRADVRATLADSGPLDALLQRCIEAVARRLDAAHATVWLLDDAEAALELRARAGDVVDTGRASRRVPLGRFRVGRVAQDRAPCLANDLAAERRPGDKDWAGRAGLVSFAGYPLLVEDRLVGVVAMFARQPLPADTLDALAAVADLLAQGIERKRAERALRATEERFRAIVETTAEWIFEVDAAGRFVYSNPAVSSILGYRPDELLGTNVLAYVHEDELRGLVTMPPDPSSTERFVGKIQYWRHKDGDYRALEGSAVPAIADGTVVAWRGIGRDVTERERTGRELAAALAAQQAANAELERLNKVKSDFVSVVSHEFRTPLTSIQGFSELIRDEALPPEETKGFADDINRNARRLARMIDGMLDFDRLHSGQTVLRHESVDLGVLVAEVVETLRPTASRHAIALDLDPALPAIPGDPDRLTQLVTNLIGNAIKYSPDGGGITIFGRRDGEAVHLAVRDPGLGIPPEALDTIFERYARVESGPGRGIPGTGLGLPIAREIVELHGGRIWAESEPGRGSTFHVVLPVADHLAATAAARS